jgi:UDP:flavonoid glycosyltransferase YjiC (YdhE family)
MAKIVIATFGSLGDLHPKIAIGLELLARGHDVTLAAMDYYREKIEMTGLNFAPMAPHFSPEDMDDLEGIMDARKGSEVILRQMIIPNLRPMYEDMTKAVDGADLFLTGEVVFAARSVVEKTGVKWVSTSVAPISFFSIYDPPVPPPAPWFEHFRFLGPGFQRVVNGLMRKAIGKWFGPYRQFRRELGLSESHQPLFDGKYSEVLHLALFSHVLGAPQPDWPPQTVQTGFCFYDGQKDTGTMPEGLSEFLDVGEPPIVFTLGSAAVLDPKDFFHESVRAAKLLGRRAVLLHGLEDTAPDGLNSDIVDYPYAPYSLVFPRAACVVHQGGVGTTGQVLRAGVPHLIMPFGHDQPDNATRCRRIGVAEIIRRNRYNGTTAAAMLKKIMENDAYRQKAKEAAMVVNGEGGTAAAADAIEKALSKDARKAKISVLR